MIKADPRCINVAGRLCIATVHDLLGRHVSKRPANFVAGAAIAEARIDIVFGKSKVGQLDLKLPIAAVDKNVCELDISMHNFLRMCELQPFKRPYDDADRNSNTVREFKTIKILAYIERINILHDQIRKISLGDTKVDKSDYSFVLETQSDAGFATEFFDRLSTGDDDWLHNLYGD